MRTVGPNTSDPKELTTIFYQESSPVTIYAYTLYSLIILTIGNDVCPVTIG